MHISFGKKNPITKCQIYDNREQKLIPAIISEFDCKDTSDIDVITALDNSWEYKDTISLNMRLKNFYEMIGRPDDSRFYALENNEGEIIGISYFDDLQKTAELRFIESRDDHRYKYVGQNLIATIGKCLLNKNQDKLIVRCAVSSAFDFYEKVCGFKDIGYSDLEMDRDDVVDFIKRTEARTRTQIIDIKG